MPTRDERAAQAAKTTSRMKAIFPKEIQKSIEGVRLYNEGDGWNLPIEQAEGTTEVVIKRGSIAKALVSIEDKPCMLDPASYTKAAGSYMAGGWGPEAMLCDSSNLQPILEALQKSFFDKNKPYFSDGLCSDRAAFVPEVMFLQNGDIKPVDVVVMAEPNRKRALESGRRSEAECDSQLKHRIQSALGIAASNGCKVFVATAFGCGFNGNDPQLVASIFKEWIEAHPGVFTQLIFVLGRDDVQDAFTSVFTDAIIDSPRRVEKVVEVVEEPEESDEMNDVPAPNADGVWVF